MNHLFSGAILRAAVLILFAGVLMGSPNALCQTVPTYAGRPFVLIAPRVFNDPVAGVMSGFGRAQLVGDSVVFAPLSGFNASGVFKGRGGPLKAVAVPGSPSPGGNLLFFHDGFACGTTTGNDLVIAAGNVRPDGLLRTDGTSVTMLLASGSVLPDSGGKVANVLGEPNYVGGSLAIIAAHRPAGLTDSFRGVYRVKVGALEKVSDTTTELPGLGVPDTFSSQVGFDGNLIAFWAAKGPSLAQEGIFMQVNGGGVTRLALTGDAFPDGGTMDGFISPPFVENGAVYFFAYDSANVTRLLKFENGTLTLVAKDGDITTEKDSIQSLGQFGLSVEGGKVYFPALTARGPGVYLHELPGLRTVVPPGLSSLGGVRPAAYVLQDVAGDSVVLRVTDALNNHRLVANLNQPAMPVILSAPTNLSVLPGARIELRTSALGDQPLAFAWQWESPTGVVVRSTTDTFLLESVSVADSGYYSVRVTNGLGSVFSETFFLNVEAPPKITIEPVNMTVEAGDQLLLPVRATGGRPMGYFWAKDGKSVTGDSINEAFVRVAASAADSGRYQVTVSNAWGQVISTEVSVTVNPAAPNPVFNGGRFSAVMSPTLTIPGSQIPFDLSAFGEGSFRVSGGQLRFAGGPAGSPRAGIFVWEGGTLTRLIGAGSTLPNGLGEAEGFTLVDSASDQAPVVVGYKLVNGAPQPVGLYRINGEALDTIADITMLAPGLGDSKFPLFFYGAVQAAGQIVFVTKIGNVSALYRASGAGLMKILSSDQDLPIVGKEAIQFQSLAFDGETVSFVAATSGLQKQVALRLEASGQITKILAMGDAIPGTSDTIRSFGPATAGDGSIFLSVFNPSFVRSVLEWRAGDLRRVAGSGMTVNGGGTVQRIESSFLMSAGGRVFLAGSLNLPAGTRKAVFAANSSGIVPVLVATKLDARPVTTIFVAGVGGSRVVIGTVDHTGARAFYANVGPLDDGPLTLVHRQPAPGILRLSVPSGSVLEAAGSLGGVWDVFGGSGELDIRVDGEHRFFRLRRN